LLASTLQAGWQVGRWHDPQCELIENATNSILIRYSERKVRKGCALARIAPDRIVAWLWQTIGAKALPPAPHAGVFFGVICIPGEGSLKKDAL
jgi:hypothetical protein